MARKATLQEYDVVPIDSVQLHPDNPRRNNILEIRASIKQNGFYGACVAQKSSRYILAGNGRYLAAKNEGATEIPVIWLDIDDDRALRILLVDNRTNDLAGYDEGKLREMLAELSNGSNLLGTGYDRAFLDDLLKGMAVGQAATSSAKAKKSCTCPECGHEFEI